MSSAAMSERYRFRERGKYGIRQASRVVANVVTVFFCGSLAAYDGYVLVSKVLVV
jgi:hypothetical protein